MPHVFVETNWVVDCCAPAHNRVPAALDLLRRARNGEIQLHLPSICLAEAQSPLRRKFQPRLEADRIRRYVSWALDKGALAGQDANTVRTVIDQMENAVRNDLRNIEVALRDLAESPGLEIEPYDDAMMNRAIDFALRLPKINPYDQAVLAAVIVRAERLLREGDREIFFCELDSDLQPWDSDGAPLEPLKDLYDLANVWVYSDYLLQNPEMPPNWHDRAREPLRAG